MSRASSSTRKNAPNGRRNASQRRPNCRCGLPDSVRAWGASERATFTASAPSINCCIGSHADCFPSCPRWTARGSICSRPTWQRAGSLAQRARGWMAWRSVKYKESGDHAIPLLPELLEHAITHLQAIHPLPGCAAIQRAATSSHEADRSASLPTRVRREAVRV